MSKPKVILLLIPTIALSASLTFGQDKRTNEVCRELTRQYAKLADANQRRDLAAILALRSRDFSTSGPDGQHSTYEQMAEYSRQMVAEIRPPIHLRNTILELTLNGDEAAAVVLQEFSRMQIKVGKLHRIVTSAIQKETWLRTPDGWKLKFVEDVHDRRWFVDGKRIDPNKPYNPDDPPFSPTDDPPRPARRESCGNT